ncbi:MAG TPA: hypothetical protein VH417_09870 [Vicinamibacterales bacterium]|jgi:hypothetical protein
MTTPFTPMPFTMRILGRLEPVRFPDQETGLAALDQFAAERGLAVHYNFRPDLETAIATAHPYGGDAFVDAVAVLRQEPMTPDRFRVTLRCLYTGRKFDVWVDDRARIATMCRQLDAIEVGVEPSSDADLQLMQLLTLFDVPRQIH